jgi:oligopeptide transport system substrate-binding protein
MTTFQKSIIRLDTFVSLFILLSWFSCGRQSVEQQTQTDGQPTYGGTFRLAQLPPQTLDPLCIDDIYESALVNQIFDGLLTFDVNLRPIPALAKTWTISQDRLTYTFTLRDGVTFHNGRELTAQDVLFSLTRIFDASTTAPGIAREYLGSISGAGDYQAERSTTVRGLRALDRYTVRMTLEKPSHDVLTILAMDNLKIIPKDECELLGADGFAEHPVGTGPFQFVSWEKNHRIVLKANKSYFQGRPYLDSLIFEVPLEYNEQNQVAKFFDGRLETIAIPVGQLEQFTSKNIYTVVKRPELSFEFIGFNLQHPPLKNRRVRQAISHAIDRKKMIELDPQSFLVATGILPPGMLGFSPAPKTYPYDPERAKQHLAEADLLEGLTFERLECWGVGTDTTPLYENDQILKENLAAIGIELDVKYESWLEFDQRVAEGKAPLFSMSLLADTPDPASFLFSSFHSQSEMNYFSYQNPVVDSLLEEAQSELNDAERSQLCQEAEKMILADAPIVPLDHVINIYCFQPYVQGIELSPYGLADISMEKIWIARTRKTGDSPVHDPPTTNHHP